MFLLADCRSCFASCEQIYRPDLRGKPVVVLSNNDGCVVARSREAKALGIPDLEAFYKIQPLLRQHNVTIFSSNYALYGDISNRVMTTLSRFSPEVEIYSIDEMFLDINGVLEALADYGQTIKQTVWRDVRMPIEVGIAPTKTLTKIASHAAKKISKLNGVCVLDQPHKWQWVQQRLPVKKIWGIGSRFARRLNALDIFTAYDLANADPKQLRKQFNINVERTINELNGIACYSLEQQPPARQQIFCTRSFGSKLTTLAPLEQSVSGYAARAAEKLRAQNHTVKTLQVFINTSPYEPDYYSRSCTIKLPFATDDSRFIIHHARKGLRKIFQANRRYLKAGVGLVELQDKSFQQHDLFHPGQPLQSAQLMAALDTINRRYGQGSAYIGAEGSSKRWKMRQQYLSPGYTTRWSDMPRVRC
ncbi:Y-family DNA polymerase [Oceanicoccus sagamiensis]|uniref:UMUC domain-containing protein DNA-repair protein n=1 Tax=Oceanicoccus sagamiensis TaxID=716816 RepID=A0A1X9NK53_9GAMM|nr:Y-family DNA polymerase [Oceanicoccus sagamiensis]ARN75829.1 UMUC domain-containing protein DNA-repair protein [Oceanicoccus sagamiensis]